MLIWILIAIAGVVIYLLVTAVSQIRRARNTLFDYAEHQGFPIIKSPGRDSFPAGFDAFDHTGHGVFEKVPFCINAEHGIRLFYRDRRTRTNFGMYHDPVLSALIPAPCLMHTLRNLSEMRTSAEAPRIPFALVDELSAMIVPYSMVTASAIPGWFMLTMYRPAAAEIEKTYPVIVRIAAALCAQ